MPNTGAAMPRCRRAWDRLGLEAVVFYGSRTAPEHPLPVQLAHHHRGLLHLPAPGEPTLFVQLSNHLPNAQHMAVTDDVRFGGSSPTGSVDSCHGCWRT